MLARLALAAATNAKSLVPMLMRQVDGPSVGAAPVRVAVTLPAQNCWNTSVGVDLICALLLRGPSVSLVS